MALYKQKLVVTLSPNRTVFLQMSSAKGCQGFPQTEMHNGGRVLLAVLYQCVPIKVRVATFDTNYSVTDSTPSVAASIQKLLDSVVDPVSGAGHGKIRCVRRTIGFR